MKASELRIGNLVSSKNADAFTVTGIKDRNIYVEGYSTEYGHDIAISLLRINQAFPIELTPEWLERMGFEKAFNGYWDDKDEFRIYEDGEGILYLGERIPCNRIKYIHQLQNLYFALTGLEIEIKQLESV